MNNNLETPWSFAHEFSSPNGNVKLTYGWVGEVAMGAPLSGECFLLSDHSKLKLNGMFGGPPIWSENSAKAAIPYWTQNRFQKLAIIDIKKMKIQISERTFRVIQLQKFENHIVSGIDSPIYKTEKIDFNINTEKFHIESLT